MLVTIAIASVCAILAFFLIMSIASLLRSGKADADDKVKKRLRKFVIEEADADSIDLILKRSSMSEVAWFNRVLEKLRFASNLEKAIKQGNAKGSAGIYLLIAAILAMIGLYVGIVLAQKVWVGFLLAGILAYLPFAYVARLKGKRMDRFQAQLPDSLDLMSRALKAGHTFSGAMRMVADETEDPIAGEFRITLDEINYGVDVDRALANLEDRVEVTDLKFFVVSINIQRETGGNLAEIISNIARLVRERFVLFGKVKILSAEGRISALLLSALPFFIAGVLFLLNPKYMSLLWSTELGRSMAWGAFISMVIGMIIMRRMVKIKV